MNYKLLFDPVRLVERIGQKTAAHVTTCSHFLADRARERGARQASVIHNGIWSFSPTEKDEARQRFGLERQAFYVGFMGRTCDELSWCVDAVAANLEAMPQLRLAICGMTPELIEKAPPRSQKTDGLSRATGP